jgi:hypothetical protein
VSSKIRHVRQESLVRRVTNMSSKISKTSTSNDHITTYGSEALWKPLLETIIETNY